jgi:hypothetical protein
LLAYTRIVYAIGIVFSICIAVYSVIKMGKCSESVELLKKKLEKLKTLQQTNKETLETNIDLDLLATITAAILLASLIKHVISVSTYTLFYRKSETTKFIIDCSKKK